MGRSYWDADLDRHVRALPIATTHRAVLAVMQQVDTIYDRAYLLERLVGVLIAPRGHTGGCPDCGPRYSLDRVVHGGRRYGYCRQCARWTIFPELAPR